MLGAQQKSRGAVLFLSVGWRVDASFWGKVAKWHCQGITSVFAVAIFDEIDNV